MSKIRPKSTKKVKIICTEMTKIIIATIKQTIVNVLISEYIKETKTDFIIQLIITEFDSIFNFKIVFLDHKDLIIQIKTAFILL